MRGDVLKPRTMWPKITWIC